MPAESSASLVDVAFNIEWAKLGKRPDQIQFALAKARSAVGGNVPAQYVPPPQRQQVPDGGTDDDDDGHVEYPLGIDVSDAQGTIDWQAVAGASIAFAYAKASEGTGRGGASGFRDNWKGMRDNGIFRGAYHYFHAYVDAQIQADTFMNAVRGLDPNSGDLPPVLDVEEKERGTSATDKADRIAQWLTLVEQAMGMRPVIYAGPSYWKDFMADTNRFTSYPLWIAQYSRRLPTVPGGWPTWNIWQFTDTGRVPGISGDVDMDRMNSRAMVP
jgi:lysozyme